MTPIPWFSYIHQVKNLCGDLVDGYEQSILSLWQLGTIYDSLVSPRNIRDGLQLDGAENCELFLGVDIQLPQGKFLVLSSNLLWSEIPEGATEDESYYGYFTYIPKGPIYTVAEGLKSGKLKPADGVLYSISNSRRSFMERGGYLGTYIGKAFCQKG